MIKGCGAEFHLARLRRFPVYRQNQAEQLELLGLQRGFVIFGELFSFAGKSADNRVFLEPGFLHPRQLREHLHVSPVARRKRYLRLRSPSGLRPFMQLHKARPSRHQMVVIYLKRARQNLCFVLSRQLFCGLEGQSKPGLIKFSARIFLQLYAQRRHDVESGVEFWKVLQHRHHAPIVLERVEPRPRQARIAPSPGPGIAADACATTTPNARDSSRLSFPCPLRCRVTLTVRVMRILDRYIVREVFRHALLGLAVFTFVFFVPQLVRLMELFVRHSGSGAQILELFLCIFPTVFTFTLPMAVLIGVLLGLGRMSADSEIIALTALGIGRRRILLPVGVLAMAGAVVTLGMTLWLGPMAVHKYRTLETDLIASQISFAVQPRVFDERFPKYVLYVNDVSASGTRWHGVFLAQAGGESGSQLTLAEDAIVIAEPKEGKLELHLKGGTTHEFSREDPDRYSVTAFGQSDWPIEVNGLAAAQPRQLSNPERSLRDLAATNDAGWREARVELHRRLAFPAACLVFASSRCPWAHSLAEADAQQAR